MVPQQGSERLIFQCRRSIIRGHRHEPPGNCQFPGDIGPGERPIKKGLREISALLNVGTSRKGLLGWPAFKGSRVAEGVARV